MSCLMHAPDAELTKAIAEMARVLVSGGIAVVGLWGGDGSTGMVDDDVHDPPRFFAWRTDEQVTAAFGEVFVVEQFEIIPDGRGQLGRRALPTRDDEEAVKDFSDEVATVLMRLEPGEVVSYGEVAEEAGFPGSGPRRRQPRAHDPRSPVVASCGTVGSIGPGS